MTRLKAAVIGAGWFAAQNHIPVMKARPEVVLDGVCRLGTAELERVRAHFGFAFASEDHRAVLDRRPDIVVVSSPHRLHFVHARDALEAGAHVLCEKPMTLSPEEAWALVGLARRQGRQLLIANSYHYLPQVAALRDRIADGAIGRLEHAMVSFISVTRDVFVGSRGLDRWQTAFFRPDRSTWQDPEAGGGFAWGQLSHSLALMFFLTGAAPERIAALTLEAEGVDIADAATLRLAGGAVASVSGSAAMPQTMRALMRVFLCGSGGVALAEFDRGIGEFRLNDRPAERVDLRPGDWDVVSTGPVHALVDLALGQGRNLSPGAIGAQTVATIAALLASARAGGAPVAVAGPEAGA
ncbi:MAG: Gfo/Idh/MocA family oxidoreductase [Rhodobacteraceae bacterium]|jgi:predicted dehydrogenase|nr:Gfo/Idh/MocA family oxidoreductase [Paracoccaceae bacterium]